MIGLLSGQSAFAQSSEPAPVHVRGGLVTPFDVNGSDEYSHTSGNSPSLRAGLWTDVAVPLTSRLRLQFGLDVPASDSVRVSHPGSAGYRRDMRHRDTLVAGALAFQPSHARFAPVWVVVGAGIVFARTEGFTTYTGLFVDFPPERIDSWGVNPAFLTGLDFPFDFNERLSFVGRLHVRFTKRSEPEQRAGFGWFGFSPSAGVAVRF